MKVKSFFIGVLLNNLTKHFDKGIPKELLSNIKCIEDELNLRTNEVCNSEMFMDRLEENTTKLQNRISKLKKENKELKKENARLKDEFYAATGLIIT